MSDRVERSYHGSEGRSKQASYPCESVWMAHWMCTSCTSETKACGHASFRYEDTQHHNHDVKKHSLFGGFREVTEPKRVQKIDEGLSLTESSEKARKERWEGQSFPMFSLPRKTSSVKQNLKTSAVHEGIHGEKNSAAMPACALEAPLHPEPQVTYHNFLENNSLAVSKSYPDELMRSDSKIVPHQFKGGSISVSSLMSREEEINQSNSLLAPRQHVTSTNNCTGSQFLAHEKNINSKFVSRRSGGSLSRQNDVVLLQHDHSTSSKQKQVFFGKNFREMQNQSGIGLLPSNSSPTEVTELGKVYQGCHSLPSLPRSVHNMETMRICATVNAEEGSSKGPSKFSKTTHHFHFTKKTGVNLSEGGQIFGLSAVSKNLKGKAFSELLRFSPEYGFPVQPGLKLLPYRSSTDGEGEEDVRDVKAHAVESSSETDIMDMDAFQDNLLPGVVSSPSDKHDESGKKSPIFRPASSSGRGEIGAGLPYTKLLDINQELPDLSASASSAEERETSTSRTQSLDVEHLLSHAEQPTNSKSSAGPEGPQGPEPNSRWVKRLKLSASQSAHGTKSSKMGDVSSHEKVYNSPNRNMRRSISSQPGMDRSLGKEQMELDQTATLLRNGESSSSESVGKIQNITLSHPWIRRWSNKLASQKKREAVVVFPSQCSKPTVDKFQKKQFPSIAAMALMGKAMSGFHPCEFANKGSFVVWNTKGF